jgi:hypothetical protein
VTSAAFLRACLRRRLEPGAADEVRACAGDLDVGWEELAEIIEAERLGPLLHRTAGDLGIFPPPLEQALSQSYRFTTLRNMLLLRELGRILGALERARVPVIVLKGAALAETVYGNLSLRPMGDVDLLVQRRDQASACGVIGGLGYSLGRAETHPGALAEHENELVLYKADRVGVSVDLHWSLFDSPYYQSRIAMDWFWQTAQTATIAGVTARVLAPEALLIHLCGHLALHHGATGLLWWHDIAEVLAFDRARIDWGELLSRTQRYGLLAAVRAILPRVVEEWQAPMPADALQALLSRRPSAEEQRIFAQLSAVETPVGRRFWADLASMSGWRPRLRFAGTNLFPSAAYMRQRYAIAHPLLLPFYYPYRWWRGLRGLR